jgi:putative ABC transport system substrate-binding protein
MQFDRLKRRDFVTLLSGAMAWPLTARAQQAPSVIRRIGVLMTGPANLEGARSLLDPFRHGLRELGWIEGQNLSVEYRFADGKTDLLPQLVSQLIRLRSEVIVTDGTPAAVAARNASSTIAIVMAASTDPVQSGLVASLKRPGGNITGLAVMGSDLAGKRLQLLAEIVPRLARVAVLFNPKNPTALLMLEQTRSAAPSLNVEVHSISVREPDELDTTFAAINAVHPGAFVTTPDGMIYAQRARIVAFAAASRLPALFPEQEVAREGGFMAYGPSVPASFHRAASFVDKILHGARPGDLPIEQPVKFELVINLKTAKNRRHGRHGQIEHEAHLAQPTPVAFVKFDALALLLFYRGLMTSPRCRRARQRRGLLRLQTSHVPRT